MPETTTPQALYAVYLAQNGSRLDIVLDKANANKLYRAVQDEGVPVSIWYTGTGQSVGIQVVPSMGGIVLSMQTAVDLPCDPTNKRVLTPQEVQQWQQANQQIGTLTPKDQQRGEVVIPGWSSDPSFADVCVELRKLNARFEQFGEDDPRELRHPIEPPPGPNGSGHEELDPDDPELLHTATTDRPGAP